MERFLAHIVMVFMCLSDDLWQDCLYINWSCLEWLWNTGSKIIYISDIPCDFTEHKGTYNEGKEVEQRGNAKEVQPHGQEMKVVKNRNGKEKQHYNHRERQEQQLARFIF